MVQVLCEVTQGLRESERTVTVKDVRDRQHTLRVPFDFVTTQGAKNYITVGVVGVDRKGGTVLIELPHEADSGSNRLWVRPQDLLEPVEALA